MKLKVLLKLIITLSGITVYSQDLHKINIDYETRAPYELPKNIEKGDFYQIILENINLNRYRIAINSKDSILQTSALKMPTFESFSLDVLSSLTDSFNIQSLIQNIAPYEESVDSLTNKGIETYHDKMDGLIIKNINPKTPKQQFEVIASIAEVHIVDYTALLSKEASRFDEIKYALYTHQFEKLKSEYDAQTGTTYDFDHFQQEAYSLRSDLKDLTELIKKDQEAFKNMLNDNIKKYLKTEAEATARKDKILTAYNELLKKINELSNQLSADKILAMLSPILFMDKPQEYKSFPIPFTGDLTTLTITKTPRDTTGFLDEEKLTITFPLKRDLEYWNVGTSFYYSGLGNDRITAVAKPVNDSTIVYNLYDEGRSSSEIGIAANFRYGTKLKNCEKLGIHFAVGPGISIDKDIRPRLLTGIGLSYGDKHNVVVDFGGIFGFVERQSSSIDFSTDYPEIPQTTITKLKSSCYLSLGYTFNL